jgi:hypothetical protein
MGMGWRKKEVKVIIRIGNPGISSQVHQKSCAKSLCTILLRHFMRSALILKDGCAARSARARRVTKTH